MSGFLFESKIFLNQQKYNFLQASPETKGYVSAFKTCSIWDAVDGFAEFANSSQTKLITTSPDRVMKHYFSADRSDYSNFLSPDLSDEHMREICVGFKTERALYKYEPGKDSAYSIYQSAKTFHWPIQIQIDVEPTHPDYQRKKQYAKLRKNSLLSCRENDLKELSESYQGQQLFTKIMSYAWFCDFLTDTESSVYSSSLEQELYENEEAELIGDKVRAVYRGGLEPFIDAIRAAKFYLYQLPELIYPPELEDVDYFLYMDLLEQPLTFVTTSHFWAYELQYAPFLKSRVMHWDDFQREILKDEVKLG